MPPQMPQMPSNQMGGNPNSGPNLSNISPSQEKVGEWQKSVARSAVIKSATSTVIKTRADFEIFLKQNGMYLLTSAVEFQQTGDFILSSYVFYRNYQDYREPLAVFLQRYPQLQQAVIQIRDSLRPVQQNMQVVTPRLSNPNPFAGITQ